MAALTGVANNTNNRTGIGLCLSAGDALGLQRKHDGVFRWSARFVVIKMKGKCTASQNDKRARAVA